MTEETNSNFALQVDPTTIPLPESMTDETLDSQKKTEQGQTDPSLVPFPVCLTDDTLDFLVEADTTKVPTVGDEV